jgi:HEAT repeat protein
VGGGGHPRFEVAYRWVPERKQVDLTVKQIQSDLPFENDFRLPVEVEIADASGAKTHRVELSGWSTTVALPSESRPTRVTFDKGGWLVCEVEYPRPIAEILAELSAGDLSTRLRAARQLSEDFPTDPRSVEALARILAAPEAHWGLKQEAALDLGRIGGSAALPSLTKALGDANSRVRRAVALALGAAGEASAADALRRSIETDKAEDVVAAAEISLGRLRAAGAKEYLTRQLSRDSRWWDSVRLGALIGLGKLADPTLASSFDSYTDPKYVQEVRLAALAGWEAAAPEDPRLAERLRRLTSDRNRTVRLAAIQKLGKLHREVDLPLLEALSKEPDPSVAQFARDGIEEIKAFTGSDPRKGV